VSPWCQLSRVARGTGVDPGDEHWRFVTMRNPGRRLETYLNTSIGSSAHLNTELLQIGAGIKLVQSVQGAGTACPTCSRGGSIFAFASPGARGTARQDGQAARSRGGRAQAHSFSDARCSTMAEPAIPICLR